MRVFLPGTVLLCLVVGCSPRVPTLDEEIARQPDEWSLSPEFGASSNNWALLDRVLAIENVWERIRLVSALQTHFRHASKQIPANSRNLNTFNARLMFMLACSSRLADRANGSQVALTAAWRLKARWLDDLERLVDQTEEVWNNGRYARGASQEIREMWGLRHTSDGSTSVISHACSQTALIPTAGFPNPPVPPSPIRSGVTSSDTGGCPSST